MPPSLGKVLCMSISHEDLLRRVRAFEPTIQETASRVLPTAFELDDVSLSVFPAPMDWTWASLLDLLRETASRGVLSRIPLFWQLESALHAVCAQQEAILYLNDAANMPLGAAALRGMHIDTVLTDAKDARTFSDFLSTSGVSVRTWVVIHPLTNLNDAVPTPVEITAHEYHLFPGVPVLVQCARIAADKARRYHVAEGFVVERDGEASVISSLRAMPIPIEKYRLPALLRSVGACSCGKETFVKSET